MTSQILPTAFQKDSERHNTNISNPNPLPNPYPQIKNEGDLVISDVRTEDAGTFECLANNVVGTRKSASARLIIRAKPRILKRPQDATKLKGEMVEFTCEVAGDPKPTIVWRKEAGHIPVGR